MSAPYPTRLDVCGGKYTLIVDMDTGQFECLRYGEKWRSLSGDNMVLALFDDLAEARSQRDRLLGVLKMFADLDSCGDQRDRLLAFDAKYGVAGVGRHTFLFDAVHAAIAAIEGGGDHEPV